jgi:ribose transport system substrate-binding protein
MRKSRASFPRRPRVALAAAGLGGAAAITCLAVLAASSAVAGSGAVIKVSHAGLVQKPWLKWDKGSCTWKPTNGPANYDLVLRKAPKPMKVILLPEDTVVPFVVLNTRSTQKAAKLAGVELQVISNDYPSQTKPLQAADDAILAKPDVVISANVIDALYPTITPKYQKACIPMIAQYLSPKGFPAFGGNFALTGRLQGEYLVAQAKKKGWPLADVKVVLCQPTDLGSTKDVYDNATKVITAAGVPKSNFTTLDCTGPNPTAWQSKMADWLTSNPDAKHFFAISNNDQRTQSMANAVVNAKRVGQGLLIGAGADDTGRGEIKKNIGVSSVGYFGEAWGDYLIPMAEDIVAGKPIPSFTSPDLKVVDYSNIKKFYP